MIAQPLVDRLIQSASEARQLYHRLVLLVAPTGAGKTAALREVQERTGAPLLNVNLEMSLRMLELTETQRALHALRVLAEIVSERNHELTLLDNTEILFDVLLKQDPLRLLQQISRTRTIVAAWNGSVERGRLTYAVPGHPEFRQYPADDLLVVRPNPD